MVFCRFSVKRLLVSVMSTSQCPQQRLVKSALHSSMSMQRASDSALMCRSITVNWLYLAGNGFRRFVIGEFLLVFYSIHFIGSASVNGHLCVLRTRKRNKTNQQPCCWWQPRVRTQLACRSILWGCSRRPTSDRLSTHTLFSIATS